LTFARVQHAVLAHVALRGNVETELAEGEAAGDAGCGCAYPDWVGDDLVERSNRILGRLKRATNAQQRCELSALPMWLRADVGPARLGIVHGDATSLAGWGFAQEHLREAGQRALAARWFEQAEVDAFACTHTCLPVFQGLRAGPLGRRRWILNNGAAGMPNFRGDTAGLLTRIALEPFTGPEGRHAVALAGGVVAQAIAIDGDCASWRERFLALWPPGSDAHRSYFERIVRGPAYRPAEVVRVEA
jgi:hypothetical protein